jgi:hypothetical protein
MSKEYTYDIDKYTIGVDENGEDEIGLTVAKVENGEINFLGNCYGENARCLDLLIKENQELKKQVEERTKMYQNAYDYSQKMEGKAIILETQQKDLKEQLEEINKMIEKCGFVNIEQVMLNYCGLLSQQKEFIKWLENYLELFDYDNIDEQVGYDMIEEILQKYKSIIGENSK